MATRDPNVGRRRPSRGGSIIRLATALAAVLIVLGGDPWGTAGAAARPLTPQAALEALRSRSDVRFEDHGGWLVADDARNKTVWSFPPPGHPAYPSVVGRRVVVVGGVVQVRTSISCAASQAACDRLAADFDRLTKSIPRAMQ